MRTYFILLFLLIFPFGLQAQKHKKDKGKVEVLEEQITIVDDESCGCELYFIDSIQTTRRNDLFGFKLANGKELVEPKYKFVDKWHGNYCIVYDDYYQCGLINRQGEEVVPPVYEEVTYPSDGMIRVTKNGLMGFLNESGVMVIEPQYRAASTFFEDYAVVTAGDSNFVEYVYINKQNQIVLRNDYQYAYPFFNGYAVVKKYDRFGIIDKSGREMLPTIHELVTGVSEDGFFIASDPHGEKLAIFNHKFKPITPYKYDDILGFGDNYWTYRIGDRYGYVNTKGKEHFGTFEYAAVFKDELAMVVKDSLYGIIDNHGRTVLPFEYENNLQCAYPYQFNDGLAMVEKNNKIGFINEAGEIVIPIQYDGAFSFHDGRAPVKRGGAWAYIDTEGNLITPFIFTHASPFEYGRAEVVYETSVHKINTQGKCVKACNNFPKYNF